MSEVRIKVTPKVLTVKLVALRGLPAAPTQEQINTAVTEYMDEHPESQIPDGSVSMSKLSSDVAENVSDVPNKANSTGSYPDLIAGTADNLLSSSYKTDKTPYILRRAKGAREKGSIVGGSLVWNQLMQDVGIVANSGTSAWDATNKEYTITCTNLTSPSFGYYSRYYGVTPSHVVLISESLNPSSALTGVRFGIDATPIRSVTIPAGSYTQFDAVIKNTGTTSKSIISYHNLSQLGLSALILKVKNLIAIDLTLMFGPTIADYIYAQEQASAGAGVALAKAWAGIVNDYYPYDAGSIKSVTGLTAHRMTGKNLAQVTIGDITWNNGQIKVNDDRSISFTGSPQSNGARAIGEAHLCEGAYVIDKADSTDCYLQVQAPNGQLWGNNASAIRLTVDTPADYTIRIFARGGKTYDNATIYPMIRFADVQDATFEPYTAHEYPLDSSLTLRGVLKLDGDSIYYDGDVYKADGTVTRRYGIVDMGTLNWESNTAGGEGNIRMQIPVSGLPGMKNYTGWTYTHILCSRYPAQNVNVGPYIDKSIGQFNNRVLVYDSDYTDAKTFKAAMSGVYLLYELAEPTTEQAEPFTELQICDPSGTEEWVGASMPVGHETKYYADLKGKLEDIPDAPTADGTYTLKVTVSNGVATYSWE